MDNLWEIIKAIKTAFSGILNLGTLIGLFAGIIIYIFICAVTVYYEEKELFISLLAELQLRLGVIRNRRFRHISRWLWFKIIDLDCKRRCQLAIHSANEKYRVWLILQLPYFGHRKKQIARTCRLIANTPGISEKIAKAAQICIEKTSGLE